MSFISGLSKMGQKVYQFILRGLSEGKSGIEIMKTLREQGLGYRLSDFYNDLRLLKGETVKWDTMRYVPREKVVTERLYTPTEKPIPTNFLTIMRIDYIDLMTMKKNYVYVSVHHEAPMKRIDLENEALLTIYERSVDYGILFDYKIINIVPERGFKRV